MKNKKIFYVVCEGNTDFEMIRVLTASVGQRNGQSYVAKPLFPPKKSAHAGWPNLKDWCIRQASLLAGTLQAQAEEAARLLGAHSTPGAKKRKTDNISAALLLADVDTEIAILVQMDADVAHDLLTDIGFPKNVPFQPLCPQERLRICEKAIDTWLGPHVTKKGNSLYYCVTTLAIENWILTLHDEATIGVPADTAYDSIHFPDKILSSLGYPNINNKLKKDPPKYERYGQKIAQVLPTSITRSASLYKFCEILSDA